MPHVEIDQYGQVLSTRAKEAPFNYVASFERGGEVYTMVFLAQDELDAIKQFYKENVDVRT